jgi:TonB family protein
LDLWRVEDTEQQRPRVLGTRNLAIALSVHLGAFALLYIFAALHGLFDKPVEIVPIDLTVVVNENLDGNDNEPPPLQKVKPPEPPKPKVKPPPPKKPEIKKIEKPKELEKIVTNVVNKVEKKKDKDPPKKENKEKKDPPKPQEKRKTKAELRKERLEKMRREAKLVNKKVTIEVKDAPSGNGRTAKKTLSDQQIKALLNQGYKPGVTEQLATSEEQRCCSLVKMAIQDKWNQLSPKIGNNGTVLLSVKFNSSGGLVNVRLHESCGDRISDEAALSVARRVIAIPGLSDEFIKKYRRESLIVRYKVRNR